MQKIIEILILLIFAILNSASAKSTPPPLPLLPLPTAAQLQWQLSEMALFLHFGTNTFTDSEWGTGQADPTIFNPTHLNASQWVHVAKEAGFNRVILTAKHHDGFCLWKSDYTDYSVKSSLWRGDVVEQLSIAANEAGVQLGLYLSPWDRHEGSYGNTKEYNEYYMGQMTELLTRYGEIKEVWLDGAKGEKEKDMEYYFDSWFSLIRQLQPGAVIFSDAGPDTRWIGDEAGVAGSTCWSPFNCSSAKIGGTDPKYSQRGDPQGHDWVPAECDVSIRPGWFWHASESPKSALKLLDIYYKSVGRNCLLLLNVPPNSSGLISEKDIEVLKEFKRLRDSIFSHNLAGGAFVNASSTRDARFHPRNILTEGINTYWAPKDKQCKWVLQLDLKELIFFNVLKIQEPIQMGQRVIEFHFEVFNQGKWKNVIDGTTIGYQRLLRFPAIESRYLRFVVDKSREGPLISYLGIYYDQLSEASNVSNTSSLAYFNGSQVLLQKTSNSSQIAYL
ncbi:hypothetical protein ACFE04_007702 [Oxalis oulophora]